MFYYIHEWYKWFKSWDNGIKKDELPPEIPFEEPQPTPEEIPFEEPLPKQKLHGTGWKYK